MVYWLGHYVSTAEGMSSIPGQEIKILQTACSPPTKGKKKKTPIDNSSRPATGWEKIFIKVSNKGLISKIYEDLFYSIVKR